MSYLCLICKDKLSLYTISNSHSVDINSVNENCIVATTCGHLYHIECLESWCATEKRKQELQGYLPQSSICPYCQKEFIDGNNRRLYPIEDQNEALEKAKLVEKLENVEIYCHQLEINIEQLQRENEIIRQRNSSASPSETEPVILLKNDRIVWLKKGEVPQPGILISISKKDGKLIAKIKLDQKLKLGQRTSRILSSFRPDKTTVSVPFEEIMSEGDFSKLSDRKMNEPPPPRESFGRNIFPQLFAPKSVRSSTLSLPEITITRKLSEIPESEDEIVEAKNEHAKLVRSISAAPRTEMFDTSLESPDYFQSQTSLDSRSLDIEFGGASNDSSLDQNREYAFIPELSGSNRNLSVSQASLRSKSPDPSLKSKHVTFAESKRKLSATFSPGEHVVWYCKDQPTNKEGVVLNTVDGDEVVVEFMESIDGRPTPRLRKIRSLELSPFPMNSPNLLSPPILSTPSSPAMSLSGDYNSDSASHQESFIPQNQTFLFPEILVTDGPPTSPSPFESNCDSSMDIEEIEVPTGAENSSCFDSTFLALFYGTTAFDKLFLLETSTDDELCRNVKSILRKNFVIPIRTTGMCDPEYAFKFQETIIHLCSSYMDTEELVTILFEFTFKMPPFIRYSFEMCDYLHQFFIDFTDKNKITTVQHLFQTSLMLQDNLKLKNEPAPALILQMPHSEENMVHYDVVIPNLTLSCDHLVEERQTIQRKCFCDNEATLECSTCVRNHGHTAVFFCSNCQDILQQIHTGMDHTAEVRSISSSSTVVQTLELLAVICLREDRYVSFLRDGPEKFSPWIFVPSIVAGRPVVKPLPDLGKWLDELVKHPENLKKMDEIPSLLRRLLTDSRIYIYHPAKSV